MKQKVPYTFIVFLLSIGLTVLMFFPIVIHPNSMFITQGGDATKNIFTFLYSVRYDEGFHFSGMNYPYGEHIVYTDNMPFIYGLIQWLSKLFPGVKDYALLFMNYLMLVTIPFASIFLFKILKYFSVSNIWALGGALIITFMSPVLIKIEGHFGLALVGYLPCLLYLLMSYHYRKNDLYLIGYTVVTLFASFIHLYNLAFSSIILVFYTISYLIMNLSRNGLKNKIAYIFPIVLALIIPIIFSTIIIRFTDNEPDRPTYPYGVFDSGTEGLDIISSNTAPFGKILGQFLGMKDYDNGEKYTYVGFFGVVILFILIGMILKYLYQRFLRKRKDSFYLPHQPFHLWLLFAFLCLLMGMGFPVTTGWKSLPDYISQLRQFRTVGRFSWIFYYVFMVYVFVISYYFYKKWKKQHADMSLLLLVLFWGTYAIEATGMFKRYSSYFTDSQMHYASFFGKNPNDDFNAWLQQKGIKKEEVQCLLILPFFHIGSEKLWLSDVDEYNNMWFGTRISYQTGIPMVNSMMSRTSWSHTFSVARLVDNVFTYKDAFKSFDNRKILVAYNPTSATQSVPHYIQDWLTASTKIGDWHGLDLYLTTPQELQAYQQKIIQSSSELASYAASDEGLLAADSSAYYYSSYKLQDSTQQQFFSGDTLSEEQALTLSIILPEGLGGKAYIYSSWVQVESNRFYQPEVKFIQMNKNGDTLKVDDYHYKYATLHREGAFLGDKEIVIADHATVLQVVYKSPLDKGRRVYYYIKDALFYPARAIHFRKSQSGQLWLNNRLIPASSKTI